ncbi:class I SAM-dependent methyltransferase [Actinomadura scrupuli]|uniref:class I SAM-dependent methyltransferase n=1 Tax=Actinomadura scrupuli TaxID=559629 RepID=UPI003D9934E2
MTVTPQDKVAWEVTEALGRLMFFAEPELDQEDVVLEVACWTGLVARAIGRRVRHVTAIDASTAMLEEGKRRADRDGITNVTFARGDAADLPYLDRSFTLTVTRFSLHHFSDPLGALREMVRVSRPGAGLIVADIVRSEGPGDPDVIERLRDPSHAALLTADQIAGLLTEAGAEVKRRETFEVLRPVGQWLEQSRTPPDAAEQIRAELTAELAGGPPTGLRPEIADGELSFTHSHVFLAATAS